MREQPEQIDFKKREYFFKLGLQVREALKLHRANGLWERVGGERDWGNVSEHCLVEAARARAFADKFGFAEKTRDDLVMAAALHDFHKKQQKLITQANGLSLDSFLLAEGEEDRLVKEAGFNDNVIRYLKSLGDNAMKGVELVVNQAELTEEDLAFLAMHYIDDYTINSDWALPAEINQQGNKVNNLDRRVDKNEANLQYQKLNEDSRRLYGGETGYQVQRRLGHAVEARLAKALAEKSGQKIDPLDLPEIIDEQIKKRIEESN